jgi:prepilin-type N-terminal cleavage/methylation domain-containing protein
MSYKKIPIKSSGGFTLIEILVVIGMIAILAAVVLIAINPLRQFAQARNAQRVSNVNAILNAIGNRIAENKGVFVGDTTCTTALPASTTNIAKIGGYDLRNCLVPTYTSEIPVDPKNGLNSCTTDTCATVGENYDTKYTVRQDVVTSRITVCAPNAAETAIEGSATYCLTR